MAAVVGCAAALAAPAYAGRPQPARTSAAPSPQTAPGTDAAPSTPRPGPRTYVLLIVGASGSEDLAEKHRQWVDSLGEALRTRAAVPEDQIIVLGGPADDVATATREGIRDAIARLGRHVTAQDTLLVVLVGHSTFDGVDAKFNLVGPDLAAAAWRALLSAVAGRITFVHTTGASFPFLQRLAGPNRIVITATATPAQKYDTVFPQFFVTAWSDPASDLDRNGRVSVWEAFSFTSAAVKRWYEQKGQLPVERALLDDTGDGIGRDLTTESEDGVLASRTFLDPDPDTAGGDPTVALLITRRNLLEAELDELKRKRGFLPAGDYERELERLVVEIARISRDIRRRIKS